MRKTIHAPAYSCCWGDCTRDGERLGKLKDYMYRGEEVCAGMCRALGDGAAPALGALLVDGLVDGLGRGLLVGLGQDRGGLGLDGC